MKSRVNFEVKSVKHLVLLYCNIDFFNIVTNYKKLSIFHFSNIKTTIVNTDKNKCAFLNIDHDVGTIFTFKRYAVSTNAPMRRCVLSRYKVYTIK